MYGPAFRPVITAESLRQIEQRIPGLVLDRLENQAYQTAYGQLHGLALKLTYHHNRAQLEVGERAARLPLYRAEQLLETAYPDHLPATGWLELFCQLVPQLQRTSVRWEFTGVTTRDYRYLGARNQEAPAIGQPQTYYVTAPMAEQGLVILRRLLGPDEFERAQIDPTPAPNRHYEWPDPEPQFIVLPEAP
jgi:hypothetical protein